MLIRQRCTIADDFLLQVVFPYVRHTRAEGLIRLARLWNSVESPARAQSPVAEQGRMRGIWKKLAGVVSASTARASAH